MNFKIFNELYEDETNSKASWLPENDFLLTEGIMKAKGLFSMRLNSGNHSDTCQPKIFMDHKYFTFYGLQKKIGDVPAFSIINYDS